MRKFIVLSRYHIRKNKGQYISLSIIVMIAAMVFGIGLITVRNFGKMYQEKFEQYECADVFYSLYDSDWDESVFEKAKELDGVTATEIRKNIMLSGEATYGETGNSLSHIFFNMDEKHDMNKIETIGDTLDLTETKNPIYISYWIQANGCKLGDVYKFVSGETTYEFTIAGFIEDLMYGNNNCGYMGVYLPEKDFNSMYDSVAESSHARTLAMRLTDEADGKEVFTEFTKMIAGSMTNNYTYNYGYLEMSSGNRTKTATIMAGMLMSFSALLVIITMFVINFRIKSSMDEEMQNMGVLTSVGYTSKQVIWSVAVPYVVLGVVAVVLGLIGSFIFLPVIQNMFGTLSGLIWERPFDIVAMALVILVVMGLILFTALFSARRIKKLHPIEALRSGIKHHSFKKNYFPLEKTRTNLNIAFGLKGLMSSIKQSVFLFLILGFVSFSTIYLASSLYNSKVAPENFIKLVSEENPMISLTTHNHQDAETMKSYMEQDNRVDQVIYYDSKNVIIGEDTVGVFVLDEHDKLTNDILYSGRAPKHDNEIVIGSAVADTMKVKLGESIKVKSVGKELEYYVVGMLQAPNFNGSACEMTPKGFLRLNKDFEQTTLYVYLKDTKEVNDYAEEIAAKYKDELASYCNYQSMIDEVYQNFIPIMGIGVGFISAIVMALIIAVLYMIIKTVVTHRKQELGISKALGYTTMQLVRQLTYSLLPSITLGTIVGGVLGYLYEEQLWLLFLNGIGIRKAYLPVPILWAVAAVLLLVLFSMFVSVIIARRIKHISPIKLIKE